MPKPAVLLIVLGLLLGPGYRAYCERLSGENLQSLRVAERADRWTLPDGTIQRFRKGLAYRPVLLTLDPQLNRLRLRLAFEFPAEGDAAPVEYLATLLDQDYPVIEQPLLVSPVGRVETTVRTFEVQAPGDYLFLLEEVGPARPAATVTVQLRGRIQQPVQGLVWFGYALSLAGMGWLAYALAAPRLRRLPRRP